MMLRILFAGSLLLAPIANSAVKVDGKPFNASLIDLAKQGYVEEEFFLSGTARTYDIPRDQMSNAVPSDATHPFKTRIVVRRPATPAKFNGVVVVEWTNVSEGFDNEVDWFHSGEHFVRSGYAWVGVSAQNVGVTALKQRMADRYNSLDVVDSGAVSGDGLSYDIFTAVGQVVRGKGGENVLGGLKAERLIASGHSQSAGRLATYFNSVHPLKPVYDAVLLHGGGGKMRTDLNVKIWKLLSETDVIGQIAVRQPDSDKFRTWEVAGVSHLDYTHATQLVKLGLRSKDTMLPNSPAGPPRGGATPGPFNGCSHPPLSRIPGEYVQNAVYDHMVRWLKDGTLPPTAAPIEIVTDNGKPAIDRDSFGNALGGVRLAEHAVATAVNSGENSGTGFCFLTGWHEDFDKSRIGMLYSSHQSYVSDVKAATDRNLKAGYIVKADAMKTIANAEQSSVARP
jgi:Alpha/beta hydrolase domain